jgi:hypothetical protein
MNGILPSYLLNTELAQFESIVVSWEGLEHCQRREQGEAPHVIHKSESPYYWQHTMVAVKLKLDVNIGIRI